MLIYLGLLTLLTQLNQPQIKPGAYYQYYGGSLFVMTLEPNNIYSAIRHNDTDVVPTLWLGSWEWNPISRKLRIIESNNSGRSYLDWSAVLNKELQGEGQGNASSLIIKVKSIE